MRAIEKEQALRELEELTRDANAIIEEVVTDLFNTGIDSIIDATIYYYNYEPEIVEGVYNELLERYKISEPIDGTLYYDANGNARQRVRAISKYSRYNQSALRDLLPRLCRDYLKALQDKDAERIKAIKQKEKDANAIKQKEWLFFIDCFVSIYKKQPLPINQFVSNLNSTEFRDVFFEELGYNVLDYETLKNYNKAVKEFTKTYQEPTPSKERKTIAGLSIGAFGLAGLIGLIESYGKK